MGLTQIDLIADIGIIGLPNVGKSSFLKFVTNANPKIANYPFTTLFPKSWSFRLQRSTNNFS